MSEWIEYKHETKDTFPPASHSMLNALAEKYESVIIRPPILKNENCGWVVSASSEDEELGRVGGFHHGATVEEAANKFAKSHGVKPQQ